jgi:hypothetical protein
MDRALVIVLAACAVVLVGLVGGAIGFVFVASDPAVQAQRACASGQVAPGTACSNFRVTARSANRVEYTYDLSDGSHCIGSEQVESRGAFGFPNRVSGEGTCSPAGQPRPTLGGPPAPPTAYPDGNPACTVGVSFSGPAQTDAGFAVMVTNGSIGTCDVSGPASLLFLDSYGQPITVAVEVANEASSSVVLKSGASAVYDFDAGSGPCVRAANIVVIAAGGSQELSAPPRVCAPITAHSARAGA